MINHSATLASQTAVVSSTPLVSVPGWLGKDLAKYLEEHDLDEILREQQVVDSEMLKNPALDDFFLDLARFSSVAPGTLLWLKQRRCQLVSGCRIELCEKSTLEDLLIDYQGENCEGFGYALIAAPAIEVLVVLELRACSCLLQLELPGASYLDIPVSPWKRPVYPYK